ncbi:DUF1515 family protein [Rhizobium tubonense]|uniref:DUF1515 domain-containing protein n=1 Tax=Rhizobium tubonense TaxID=484088 RepID=A0A2W4C3D0_9HYPH|nr:DUF1515 family protein [Rhizobium tubonense]PZM07571.1 hypothetical protein CPY51_31055 [Rhizobium tubonense]
MTPGEFSPSVHQQLGELIAGMRNLTESVRRSEDKSDLSRAQMHGRMDAMIDRIGKVEATVTGVQEDITEMKPVVDEVTAWRNKGIGGLFIIGIGASAITFIITLILTQSYNQILGWFSKG